jgi:hypothetical protein
MMAWYFEMFSCLWWILFELGNRSPDPDHIKWTKGVMYLLVINADTKPKTSPDGKVLLMMWIAILSPPGD